MFVDIDFNKRPQQAKFQLAKPNKEIFSSISEKFNATLSLKLGNIHELNFSIPHFIQNVEEGRFEKNEHVDTLKEKMLIKVSLGTYSDWFIVDEIVEDADNVEIFNVKAFSLGYELKHKRISEYVEEVISVRDLFTNLLAQSVWELDYIDPLFEEMARSFESGSDSNILDCIIQGAETFGGLLVWNAEERKVSLKSVTNTGKYRGMSVSYGRFIQSIKRTRTTDEMVTRLWVTGSEGLTIHNVNPTGQGYIEDFSYFMYPFKRTASREVVQSSYFMSDDLCHAILDQQIAVEDKSPQIKALLADKLEIDNQLILQDSKMNDLQLELETINGLLDLAKSTNDTELINQRTEERNQKEAEITAERVENELLLSQSDTLQSQIESLQDEISVESGFTDELLKELNLYIIEKELSDDRYIDEKELYDFALYKFSELREPKVVIDVSLDNLLNVMEEQYYWDKLTLGDLIKVKYPQMDIEYMAKIIEINYDFEASEVNLTIANTTDLLSDTEKLVKLLYSNSSASTLVQNNKYKWEKINAVQQEVNQIITQEWDATKQKITAGVNNSVEVGKRGIIIRNPDFPDEVVIMQSGVVALSKDGGETWKTAIKPDGVVAERLIGQIIAGQELLITNDSGTFTFDTNGVQIDASSFVVRSGSGHGNLLDLWNESSNFVEEFKDDSIISAYEKRTLSQEWDKIRSQFDSLVIRLNNYFTDQGESIQDVILFHNYYTALFDYLFTTKQTDGFALLDSGNLTSSTRIVKETFEESFYNYQDQVLKVEEVLSARAKELANDASELAKQAQKNIDEVENDIVWKIELSSSKGFTFKNGVIDTVVTARVYRGVEDVTSTIPNSGFIWTKKDRNGILDQSWNNAHLGVGNIISITSQDVSVKAIFECAVDIDVS
ncbi:phage tail spike protein [Halobacillus rhizosphaerae]|uniref:phage tail spike protein n=1 Tax=Halobacillus rhizosphaerae TaxID=3064889 RepID=UPI00398B60DF